MNRIVITLFLFTWSISALSQSDSIVDPKISVRGVVTDEFGNPVINAIVVNQGDYSGVFGDLSGKFKIEVKKSDILSIRAIGQETVFVSFKDSIPKESYEIKVRLKRLMINIDQVTVFAPRDLNEIYDDIETLGYEKQDYMISGIDAAQSPITFLYQQFSKKEQDKRKAAELFNEDRKRDLLKELFAKYADYQIHDLEDEEFDDFITFMNVSDSFMKSASQYEFVVYVKQRFHEYEVYRRNRGLQDEDYDYDRD